MSLPILSADAEREVTDALITALRADPMLQAHFGDPVRLFDDEATRPAFPFIRLEGWTMEPTDTAQRRGLSQTASFGVHIRHGGYSEARRLVGAFRASVDALTVTLASQKVILIQTVFSDVVRGSDLQHFRGVVRVRIITEGLDA